jgi:hypothetical protein
MKKTLSLFLLVVAIACGQSQKNIAVQSDSTTIANDSIRSEIFQLKDSSGNAINEWGYDIFMHDKLYVHQPNVPAVAGKHGFSNEEDARKVANLIISKVINHIMPPTVSVEELDSLNIGPYIGY